MNLEFQLSGVVKRWIHLLAKRSILKIEIHVYNFSMLALVLKLGFLNQTKLTKTSIIYWHFPKILFILTGPSIKPLS